jgi:carboxymethylenebutenolidase
MRSADRDNDRMLDLPQPEFGSGIIGVCDICGSRQAVIVLNKERFKLCVIDFLNKTWIKTDKKPGAPAPIYRSERVWYPTDAVPGGRAPAVALSPTKPVKRPAVLIVPDSYGVTTTLLDAAIRFASEGFEVLIPDYGKTDGFGTSHHTALHAGARLRGGVNLGSKKVGELIRLHGDALAFLRDRDMVDPVRSAVFGTSSGASLALGLAAKDTRLGAVVLAYPMPVRPEDLGKLVSAPLLFVGGAQDRAASRAREQLVKSHEGSKTPFEFLDLPGAHHHFLSRDLKAYDLGLAEQAWARIVAFLKQQLMPPPPKPPAPPAKPVASPPSGVASAVIAPAAPKPPAVAPPQPPLAPAPNPTTA